LLLEADRVATRGAIPIAAEEVLVDISTQQFLYPLKHTQSQLVLVVL
jgi:hypothetical protein